MNLFFNQIYLLMDGITAVEDKKFSKKLEGDKYGFFPQEIK